MKLFMDKSNPLYTRFQNDKQQHVATISGHLGRTGDTIFLYDYQQQLKGTATQQSLTTFCIDGRKHGMATLKRKKLVTFISKWRWLIYHSNKAISIYNPKHIFTLSCLGYKALSTYQLEMSTLDYRLCLLAYIYADCISQSTRIPTARNLSPYISKVKTGVSYIEDVHTDDHH